MPRIAEYLGLLLAMALAVVATGVADAQEPPKGPIVILVGFSAGGTTDLIARLMAEKIANALQRPVVVEDKPGAGGRIAAEALKNATPDGTTLMVAPIVVPVLAPLVYRKLDYDPVRDFAPVGQIARFQFAFAVGADHPARTLSQFVDWAKANPSRASFGTPAAGSIPHFLGVMIGAATGIEMTHVPYKGLPRLASDLVGGQIAAAIDALPDLIALASRRKDSHPRDFRRVAISVVTHDPYVYGTGFRVDRGHLLGRRVRAREDSRSGHRSIDRSDFHVAAGSGVERKACQPRLRTHGNDAG